MINGDVLLIFFTELIYCDGIHVHSPFQQVFCLFSCDHHSKLKKLCKGLAGELQRGRGKLRENHLVIAETVLRLLMKSAILIA